MILIGITGKAGSGKNYVADQIMAKYESSKQLAFADPLKQMVHHMFAIPLEDCYTEAGKASDTWYRWEDVFCAAADKFGPMTVRDLLQYVGTDLVREHWCRDHWLKLMERRINNTPQDVVIVTDVRFPNEAKLIKAMGGTVLRVVGRQAANTPSHASEDVDLVKHDADIMNPPGTTPGEIMRQVEQVVPALTSTSAAQPCVLRQP